MAAEVSPLDPSHGGGPANGYQPHLTISDNLVSVGFFIPGPPVAKGRPRFRKTGNYVQTYTPAKTRDYENLVSLTAKNHIKRLNQGVEFPLSGRTLVSLRFNLKRPKSAPKRVTHQLKKPDIDNLGKAILDGIQNGGLLKDDNIVTDLSMAKRFADDTNPEGVRVELVSWLD